MKLKAPNTMINILGLSLLLLAGTSHAASFDCSKAASATEKLICGNEAVSALDEQLGAAYKQALANASDKDSLKQQQVEWLKQQRACKDAECLTQVYQARLGQLQNGDKSSEKTIHFKLVYGDSYPLCQPYVDMLNATHYTKMPVCERKILPEFKQFKEIEWIAIEDKAETTRILEDRLKFNYLIRKKSFSHETELKEIIKSIEDGTAKFFYHKIDINRDGVDDFFYKLQYNINFNDKLACNIDNTHYVQDSKVTLDTLKNYTSDPYFSFNLSGNNNLFYFSGKIIDSFWGQGSMIAGSNLDLYEPFLPSGSQKVCGILAQ